MEGIEDSLGEVKGRLRGVVSKVVLTSSKFWGSEDGETDAIAV